MSLSHVMLNDTVKQYKRVANVNDDYDMHESDKTVSLFWYGLTEYSIKECQIILFLVEKSLARINCLLACLSAGSKKHFP